MLLGAGALALAACKRSAQTQAPQRDAGGPPWGTLEWAVDGYWRSRPDKARDEWRHPLESLQFWGLKPGMTVVEFWPGEGWYTDILAPFLAATHGVLYAANLEPDTPPARAVVEAFQKKLGAHHELYGAVKMTAFGQRSGPVAPPGSADIALFLRNIHNWMAAGLAEKAFHDAFAALKPGGVLGVEEHRAKPGGVQDVAASSGYVQQAYVAQLAKEAGFVLSGSSELNANPKDDRNHPFWVWTLPPTRRSAPPGRPANPFFDHRPYDAIGESDRMTLKFTKPASA